MDIFIHPNCQECMSELSFSLFTYKGFFCLIVRNMSAGNLNGYVAIEKDHSFYGNEIDELDNHLTIHGGITYIGYDMIYFPAGMFPGKFWIGFDTSHAGDLSPFQFKSSIMAYSGYTYKNFDYVKNEVMKLADQLAAVNFKIGDI